MGASFHTPGPQWTYSAQGALQQEEGDPREDERQEVGDQEGPCEVEKRGALRASESQTRCWSEGASWSWGAGKWVPGVPATTALYSATSSLPKGRVRPEDILCSKPRPCTLQVI